MVKGTALTVMQLLDLRIYEHHHKSSPLNSTLGHFK